MRETRLVVDLLFLRKIKQILTQFQWIKTLKALLDERLGITQHMIETFLSHCECYAFDAAFFVHRSLQMQNATLAHSVAASVTYPLMKMTLGRIKMNECFCLVRISHLVLAAQNMNKEKQTVKVKVKQ